MSVAATNCSYPPSPRRHAEIATALDEITSQVAGRPVAYLSAPITSGWRLYKYMRAAGLRRREEIKSDDLRRCVVLPNINQAHEVRERISRLLRYAVIDPTALDLPDWVQSDYRVLWSMVIERLAEAVVFVDGWQFSDGCAYEFLIAVRCGRLLFDERLQAFSRANGYALLSEAASQIRECCGEAPFIDCVVADLGSGDSRLAPGKALECGG